MKEATWKEFMDSKLLWWVNRSLHLFGWAIVVIEESDGTISKVYPARVEFRGFPVEVESDGFRILTEHLEKEIPRLKDEVK